MIPSVRNSSEFETIRATLQSRIETSMDEAEEKGAGAVSKKNYDGWCAKAPDGRWLLHTLSGNKRAAIRDLWYVREQLGQGAKVVKFKLVEVE